MPLPGSPLERGGAQRRGVENQQVLPFGTVDDVRREVIACLQTLGAGGGYIPSSCHNIQAGTPPENVIAMIETVQTWRG